MPENKRENNGRRRGRKLPPKGTAARALMAAGLWGDMSREEIEQIKHDIFSTRRSSKDPPKLTTDD